MTHDGQDKKLVLINVISENKVKAIGKNGLISFFKKGFTYYKGINILGLLVKAKLPKSKTKNLIKCFTYFCLKSFGFSEYAIGFKI